MCVGKSAVKAVLSPAYAKLKNVPKVTNESEAVNLLNSIIPFTFYLRVDRGNPNAQGGGGGGGRRAWFGGLLVVMERMTPK